MRYRWKGKALNFRDPRADREDVYLTRQENYLKESFYGRKEYNDELRDRNGSSRWDHAPAGEFRNMLQSLRVFKTE